MTLVVILSYFQALGQYSHPEELSLDQRVALGLCRLGRG